MLMIAFIGVRISWLIIARKELFARFASTACSRAATSSPCDACSAATASSIARAELAQFAAARHRSRYALRGRRPTPGARSRRSAAPRAGTAPRRRAQAITKQRSRPAHEEQDVAAQRGVQVGAIRSQRDPERDAGAGALAAKLERLGDVEPLDAVESGKAAHAVAPCSSTVAHSPACLPTYFFDVRPTGTARCPGRRGPSGRCSAAARSVR